MENLLVALADIPDPRRKAGQRHEFSHILLLILLAAMSGYFKYREIGRFIERHQVELLDYLRPKHGRLPSFLTIRKVMMTLDFEAFAEVIRQWAGLHVPAGVCVSLDGKSIRSTVSDPFASSQAYLAMVSAYFHQVQIVVGMAGYSNKEQDEASEVRALLRSLALPGATYVLDALHCKKKP